MKQFTKSNLINYTKLYNTIIFCTVLTFMYIAIKLFLPYYNLVSISLLFLSILYLVSFLLDKKKRNLIISLIITITSIGLNIICLYFNY